MKAEFLTFIQLQNGEIKLTFRIQDEKDLIPFLGAKGQMFDIAKDTPTPVASKSAVTTLLGRLVSAIQEFEAGSGGIIDISKEAELFSENPNE